MELKVWVEGIQRVVCGVNEATTCQDVVYALAHATGQTGRFTLVEKWRHSERLLPPQEYPLKVLTKWGEYAGDVQLILRRSSDKKSHNNNSNNNNKNSTSQPIHQQVPNKKLTSDFRPFSPPNVPSTPAPAASTPTQNKEIKKSLTFSGTHGLNNNVSSGSSGHSTPQSAISATADTVNLKTEPSRDVQGKVRDTNRAARQDLPRGIVKGVPQERSSPARPRQPPSYDEAVSRSSRHHLSSQPPPFNPDSDPSLPNRLPPGISPRISPMPAKDHRSSPNRSADPYVHHVSSHSPQSAVDMKRESVLSSPVAGSPAKDSQWSSDKITARKNLIGEFKKDSSPRPDRDGKTESVVVLVKDKEDPQYRDLIRLVTLQREKLTNQNAELSQFDTEIVYWEGKLQEQESRLTVLEEEIHHLENMNEEQSREISSLDHPTQMEAVEQAHQDERLLRSKLSVAKAQLTSCDTQLTHTRQRLKHLGEEFSDERLKAAEREKQCKERDEQCQEIKKQVKSKEEEQSVQLEVLSGLEKDLQVLEDGLSDRQSQLQKLTLELKDANLQALSMTIADDIKCLSEGTFHTRSGSTRRIMGSPRQLENAVPTSKNPHGVWV